MTQQERENKLPVTKSSIEFMWYCLKCYKQNRVCYANWKTFGGVCKCDGCGVEFRILEPWI